MTATVSAGKRPANDRLGKVAGRRREAGFALALAALNG
jgi:hypothetical protein